MTPQQKYTEKLKASLEHRGIPISFNDVIIAAAAIAHNGILVTNNIKEFQRIDGTSLDDWTA